MKFGKEFASQMVPEWQEAYMNYNYLKTLLKEILIFRRRITTSKPVNPRQSASLKRRVSLFRAFSGLTSRYDNTSPKIDKEDEVILVSAMQEADEEQGDQDSRSYQTIFLRSSEDGGEFELVFFKRLDHEFNKVNSFYREKVEEVVKQAEELNIQMDALIALRIKVNDPYAVSPFINQTKTGSYPLETIKESEMSEEKQEKRSGDGKEYNMASLEVLNQVKINATTETPLSTVKSVFHLLKSDFNFNKNELKHAQGKLKQAFVEFHEKLRFLKNYAFLNQLAFSKIMKKYDKITSRNASDSYLQMIEESYLSQSDEVAKLIDRVEKAFVKYFCNGNRHQAMNTLRPKAKRERHRVTFFVGCFFGCSLALVVAIIVVIHNGDLLNSEGRTPYMNTIFPLYSLFGFLVLHLLMYAGNVYYWTRYRVNYSFIFGYKAGTELGFKEVLLLGSGLSVLTLAGILSNLEMQMDQNTQSYKALTELVPLGLVIFVLLIAICPFNIVYRTNRYFLLVCLWHCICAPFYTVTLPDFFLADQFTSQTIKESEMSEEKQEKRSGDGKEYNMASLEVLNQVKINATTETPLSTVKSVFHLLKSDFNFNKNELKDAQGKLKQAFVEFHEKLRFLKNYAFLNQLAFSKIMKKYDKITSRNASDAYLQMIEESYLSQSDEVAKLIDRVEKAFVKHFSNGNRHQAMNTLRPKAKRERHRVTFFVGCFFGCSLALVVAIIVVIHNGDLLNSEGRTQYMETIFPLYSLFGFLVLHLLMYAGNVYYWTRYRVNYSFIFGYKPGTELGFKEVLLLGSGLSVLTLAGILSNLEMQMDKSTQSYQALTELVPLGLVILVLLIAFCPFNIFYRANRYFLLVCLWHCICAPFYTVTLPDFFLADQFTSQVQLLRNLQFYVCYYGWGDFKKRNAQTCNDSDIYKTISIIIAVIPYWIRVLQCVRRLCEGHDSSQALNGLKYFSTIVAVVARTIYVQRTGVCKDNLCPKEMTWKIIAASTSGFATIFSTYWDIVKDWGLLCKNSENPWLRDKLSLPNRSIYFIAMVITDLNR
ncbi:SPX domain, EXS [Artemisia annua]|uniref:SPX domain, EXS n=1 Tax=Artemisia annua TaxID=35608 RepID=A0A2U1LJC8_ARTAN|nr:SPX domain, EXS [Artemisia annua]